MMSCRQIRFEQHIALKLFVFLICAFTVSVSFGKPSNQNTDQSAETSSKQKSTHTKSELPESVSPPNTLVITLYPQHDHVELMMSEQLIKSWPLFFGYVSAHINDQLTDRALKSFLFWKRTQDSFDRLIELEDLQLILSNHLLTLEHGQDLTSDEVRHKEKLQSLLGRLKLRGTLLDKEKEWREQEQMLKGKLSPLNDLWQADHDLRRILDELIVRLDTDLSQLNEELSIISDSVDDEFDEIEFEVAPTELDLDAMLERELLNEFSQESRETILELETASSALRLFHKSISDREAQFKKCIKSLERLVFDSAELLRELPTLKDENKLHLHKVKLWMSYWNTRTQFERKHEHTSLETLLSQVAGQQSLLKTKWRGLNELQIELTENVQDFQTEYIEPIQNKSPPNIEKKKTKTSYTQVKHAHDTAYQFLIFHTERSAQLIKALEHSELLQKKLIGFLKNLRLNWDNFIEADVTQVILSRAKAVSLENFSVEKVVSLAKERPSQLLIKQILTLQEEWDLQSNHFTELINTWKINLEEDQEAMKRLESSLNGEGGLVHRLELERAWLEFIKEIEELDGPSLLAKHNEALTIYTEQKRKVIELKKMNQARVAKFSATWTELESLSDPLLRQHKSNHKEFELYAHELVNILKNEKENEPSSDSPEESQEGKIVEDNGDHREADISSSSQLATRRGESHREKVERVRSLSRSFRDSLPPRITYYRRRLYKLNELKELMSNRLTSIDTLQGELAKRVEFARQVRRTASVIRQRVIERELPTEAMNEEIEKHGQREWVEQLRAEGLEDIKKQAAYDEYRLSLEPEYNTLLKPLEAWLDLLNNILDLTTRQVKMISDAQRDQHYFKFSENVQDNQNQPDLSKETSRTLAERQFEHKLRMRMNADYPWYDFLWSSFSDDQAIDIEELLKDHYVELLRTEMEQLHLEIRINLTKTLADQVSTQRPLLESYQKQLIQMSVALKRQLKSRKLGILVRLDQQKSINQLNEMTRANSRHFDYLALKQFKTEDAKQLALSNLEQMWAVDNAYVFALDDLDLHLSPQGTLEIIAGEINDAISQLETERDELTRPLLRLLGKRARGVDLNHESPRIGEIDRLHQERIRAKLSVLIQSLLSFLLIPLITFFSFKTITAIERRLKLLSKKELERLTEEGEILTRQKRAEREDRLTTLLQVMRTTSKVVIYTVATGAMLKTLQVDVTPIIASAGIIGLAFAFGAQELVKDFFAGVFILFENQYNRGDFVTINGIFGRIDKITLRLTVIRDSHGVIHFIPNGQVQLVSNHNKEWSQAHLEIGASYNNPPKQVIDCLRRLCEEVSIDPVVGEDILGWEVLGLERFDDSAVVYRVHLRTAPKEKWRVARHYRRRVMEVFAKNGIEIPFPQMVVSLPSSSALESEQS